MRVTNVEIRDRREVAAIQATYQPGDGTLYRFNWSLIPPDPDNPTRRGDALITVTTGGRGRSMVVDMDPEHIRQGGFYLHPDYVIEKFQGDQHLARVTAHFFNMQFSKCYWRVLNRLLKTHIPEERRYLLPSSHWKDEPLRVALEAARPSRVALALAELHGHHPLPSFSDADRADYADEVAAFNAAIIASTTSRMEIALGNDPQTRREAAQ